MALTVVVSCALLGCDAGGDADDATEALPPDEPTEVESAPEQDVLAVVNDREITRQQVDQRLERLDELHRHSQRPFDDSLRSKRRERVIQRLIEQELLRDHIESQNITVDGKDVDRKLQRRVDAKFGSSDSFRRYLDAQNMSAGDYRRRIRDRMAIDKVLESEAGVDAIDEEHLREHYERIAKRRPAGKRVRVSVLHIDLDGIAEENPSVPGEIRRHLTERLDAIEDPERFDAFAADVEQIAAVHHREPRWLEKSQLRRRAADVVFGDDAPDTGPAAVEFPDMLKIYWVHERRPPGIRGFDEVEDLLYERARRSLLERHRRQLLNQLRDDANIVVHLPRESEPSEADSP